MNGRRTGCKHDLLLLCGFILLLFVSGQVIAEEKYAQQFLSIANSASIFYDAPSHNAEKLFVAGQNLPVEMVTRVEEWTKVRDSLGRLAWVESRNLSAKRFVIVNTAIANIHLSANAVSDIVFQAQQDVILEWLETVSGTWAKVRHPDGDTGFVSADQIWGL
ncbi:MAG: SH3 domain-containing protein [Nitrosomonas sp.]|nr:SH3 domain-containing protein [Nitrosomonas sp.]